MQTSEAMPETEPPEDVREDAPGSEPTVEAQAPTDDADASAAGPESPEDAADAEASEPEPPKPPQKTLADILREQLAEKETQLHTYIAAYKEAKKDMEESIARARRDREKLVDRDRKHLVGELLEVLDNLDRSVAALGDHAAADGLRMVHRQFLEVLTSFGAERMDALGARFDAKIHEAIGMIPAQPGQEDQEIVHVDRAGYVFKGDLLRAARVVVATK